MSGWSDGSKELIAPEIRNSVLFGSQALVGSSNLTIAGGLIFA